MLIRLKGRPSESSGAVGLSRGETNGGCHVASRWGPSQGQANVGQPCISVGHEGDQFKI